MIGKTISHYRILEKLGAGGMGEVYRAEDTNLSRQVAIKVLPESFAKDPERLARFAREAKLLASLNHPNIAAIHGLEEADGKRFLIMELVEGETLAEQLSKGSLPIEEALEVCRQIAEGMEAAHEKGVMHRDLKPANIVIAPDGKVKILDFGLAKALADETPAVDASQSPTITEAMTRPGVILGTAAYMSPEQAKGKPVDKRTDIWALGCLLFECLTGQRAFEGGTISETLAAILKGEPEWELLPIDTPVNLRTLLRHCLRKDPARRFQHMDDVRIALLDLKEELESGVVAAAAPPKTTPRWARAKVGWIVAAGLSFIVFALPGMYYLGLRSRFQQPPRFQQLTFNRGYVRTARFSPDGNTVIYGAAWQGDPTHVFSVRLDSQDFHSRVVPDAMLLSVSPSGQLAILLKPRITGWETMGTLARMPLSGGTPHEMLENVQWADWSPTGEMLIVRDGEKGNQLEFPAGKVLFSTPGLITHPRFSPAGDQIAFLHHSQRDWPGGEVHVVTLVGESKRLSVNSHWAWGLAWMPKTREIWFTAESSQGGKRQLQAVNLNGTQRTVNTQVDDLGLEDISRDGRVLLTSARDRQILYYAGPDDKSVRDLTWLDNPWTTDITRDGKAVVFSERGENVYYRKTDGSPAEWLGKGSYPHISPNGKSVLAVNLRADGLVLLPVGSGEIRHIPIPNLRVEFVAWLPSGRGALIVGTESDHGSRVYSIDWNDGKVKPVTSEGILATYLLVSPSGRFVAVVNLQKQVLLFPLSGGNPRVCAGIETGEFPYGWSEDEKCLYVMRRTKLPARVHEVHWETGERTLWKEIAIPDPTGVIGIDWLVRTPDGHSYTCSCGQQLSLLHLAEGLK